MDLILRNGTVIDGTGAPRRDADVGVADGRVVAVGDVPAADGAEEVDLGGLVLAPGFVDIHTHYDAQILWDPDLTPSCWHGVTSVVVGNCGFGIAPTRPEHRETIARTLENVEGMAFDALVEGIDWTFETFPEYLAALDGLAKRLNVGVLAGHTPTRLYVLGDEASDREATERRGGRDGRHHQGGAGGGGGGLLDLGGADPLGGLRQAGAQPPGRLRRDRGPRRDHGRGRPGCHAGHGRGQPVHGPVRRDLDVDRSARVMDGTAVGHVGRGRCGVDRGRHGGPRRRGLAAGGLSAPGHAGHHGRPLPDGHHGLLPGGPGGAARPAGRRLPGPGLAGAPPRRPLAVGRPAHEGDHPGDEPPSRPGRRADDRRAGGDSGGWIPST